MRRVRLVVDIGSVGDDERLTLQPEEPAGIVDKLIGYRVGMGLGDGKMRDIGAARCILQDRALVHFDVEQIRIFRDIDDLNGEVFDPRCAMHVRVRTLIACVEALS